MILIYLAAGTGSRLGKITQNKPKCFAEINGKKIIDYSKKNFFLFKKIFIITGYKSNLIKKKLGKIKNVKFIKNREYKSSNMVKSAFLPKKKIGKSDVIICYGDIIFDKQIIKKMIELKGNKNLIPLYSNWLSYWKKRMPINKIKNDAENVVTKNRKILSIGKKIKKKYPKFQFMGLIKLNNKSYRNLSNFFKFKNKKIDFTNFLDQAISEKIIELNYFQTNKTWVEIDNSEDLKVANKLIKKIK